MTVRRRSGVVEMMWGRTGYRRMPEQTAKAFDPEGFYCMGDALKPVDPNDLGLRFRFDGRVTEDFKLLTGTWVSVGPLRIHLMSHLAPYVKDIVIAGMNRDYVAVLAIPKTAAAAADPIVRAAVADRINALAQQAFGSSNCVMRLVWLTAPLSIDAGEITDNGSIDQQAPMYFFSPASPPPFPPATFVPLWTVSGSTGISSRGFLPSQTVPPTRNANAVC